MTLSDAALRQLALLLNATEMAIGTSFPALTSLQLSDEERAIYNAKLARLDAEYQASLATMDRYLDSRDAANDDVSKEWVAGHDPLKDGPVALQLRAMMQKEKDDDRC